MQSSERPIVQELVIIFPATARTTFNVLPAEVLLPVRQKHNSPIKPMDQVQPTLNESM